VSWEGRREGEGEGEGEGEREGEDKVGQGSGRAGDQARIAAAILYISSATCQSVSATYALADCERSARKLLREVLSKEALICQEPQRPRRWQRRRPRPRPLQLINRKHLNSKQTNHGIILWYHIMCVRLFVSLFALGLPGLAWAASQPDHFLIENAVDIMRGTYRFSIILPALRKTAFLSHLHIKTIILPRQARDKHRETQKKMPFPAPRVCSLV
jgi:hypothetical protein